MFGVILFVIVCTALVFVTIALTHQVHLNKRMQRKLDADGELAYSIITGLTESAYSLVDDLREARQGIDRLRRDLNLSRANVHDLEADNRRLRANNTAHVTSLSLLTTEIERLEQVQEEDRIAYVKDVLAGQTVTEDTTGDGRPIIGHGSIEDYN